MALAFRSVTSAPLENFDVAAPDGRVVGIIGENGSGKSRLLRLGGRPGESRRRAPSRPPGQDTLLGPDDALNLAPAPVLLIDHTFATRTCWSASAPPWRWTASAAPAPPRYSPPMKKTSSANTN